MAASAQDFVKGLDLTVQPSWSGADANQLVDSGTPHTDKGIVVTTTDPFPGTPDVPNATVTTKWQRYVWRRVLSTGIKMYAWDPVVASDATYLKWTEIGASTSTTPNLGLVFANYAALRAYNFQTQVAAGSIDVLVLGYATAGDGGHGQFRYDSTDTTSADDGGRVLVTTLSSYRFKRIVDKGEYAKPEWFGGISGVSTLAGAQAMTIACRKCVAYYRTLEFGVGTYYIDNKIVVPRNTLIRGAGKRLSIVHVVNASPKVAEHTGGAYYSVFMYAIQGTIASSIVGPTYLILADEGPCDNVVISDLSIYGNYEGQTKDGSNRFITNIQAITLVGGNVRVSRVEVQACGKGYSGGECFIFTLHTSGTSSNNIGPIIEDCEYSNNGRPLIGGGTLAGYGWPANFAGAWGGLEVTVIAMGCDGSTSDGLTRTSPTSGTIRGCYIHDMPRNLTESPNPINAMGIGGCSFGQVYNNLVEHVDGRGFYSDNGQNTAQITAGLQIFNNKFTDVAAGIWLQTSTVDDQYLNCKIYDNCIELYNTASLPSYNLAVAPVGILLFFDSGSFTYGALFPFDSIVIENNYISGGGNFTPESGVLTYYSRAIWLHFTTGDTYRRIKIQNNIIDVPQVGPAPYYYQEADSAALFCDDSRTIFNSTQRGGRYSAIELINNRTPAGALPYMTIINGGSFNVEFKYYQDDACIIDATQDPVDAIALNLIDYGFARSIKQCWFNTGLKRLWQAQDTHRRVLSGAIVPGRSYVVQTDDGNLTDTITYNSVVYAHNAQFNGVVGVTTFTLTGTYAKVYESPVYNWQPLTRNSYLVYSANATTYPNYGIANDRFLDSRFFVNFAAFNSDCRIVLPDPATVDSSGNLIYKGRTCYISYARPAIGDAHEIILACGTVSGLGVVTPLAGKIVDPIMVSSVDNVSLTPASKTVLGGIVGLLCDGISWFIISQISDPQEILLYTQIGTTATTPNDFELTNWAVAPFYHNISPTLTDRQMKGIVVLAFPLIGNVEARLPDPTNLVGYQFKLSITVGSGFTVSIVGIVAGTIVNPGVVGNKGEVVTTAVVAPAVAVIRNIVVEVTSIGAAWLIICN